MVQRNSRIERPVLHTERPDWQPGKLIPEMDEALDHPEFVEKLMRAIRGPQGDVKEAINKLPPLEQHLVRVRFSIRGGKPTAEIVAEANALSPQEKERLLRTVVMSLRKDLKHLWR